MDLNLKGKRALVCGSTQGLGLASAKELAMLGADVVLMARNENKLKEAAQILDTSLGQQHDYIVADFQDSQVVKHAINEYISRKDTINILVNNTGGPKSGSAVEATPDDYLAAFNSHLICNQLLVQAVLPGMKASGYGRIVNIISTSVKEPIAGLAVSNAIRGAVASWAKTLSGELGVFGITVNNVLPGMTRTARYDALKKGRAEQAQVGEEKIEESIIATIPLRRIGVAAEFGAAVAFLCSPAAAYITGINLPVDGGKLASL